MYSKYDNHQKVLLFLKEKRNEYLKRKEKLKKEDNIVLYTQINGKLNAEQIAKGLNLDLYKINETLIDLNELGLLNREDFRYSLKENATTYIESNYFKNKRFSYKKQEILKDIKDTFIILVAITTILVPVYNLFISKEKCKIYEQNLKELEQRVIYVEKEQTSLIQNKNFFLNDSLKIYEKKLTK